MRKAILLLFVAICAFSILTLADSASADDRIIDVNRPPNQIPSFLGNVPDRFVVVMKPEAGKLQMRMSASATVHIGDVEFDKLSDKYAVSKIERQFTGSENDPRAVTDGLSRYHKVTFASGSLEDAIEEFSKNPLVERVEPIGIHSMYATPNDNYFSPYQWALNAAGDHDIDAPEAWNIETGTDATVVAILDSGTRYYHPDLGGANASPSNPGASRGNMWINTAELNGTAGVDDDSNGYIDDWIGYDFIQSASQCWSGEDCNTKDNDPRDFNGHGTHTSGIFGMLTNNGYGMAGVAGGWGNGSPQVNGNGVKIMALRMGYSYNYLGQEYGVVLMDAAAEAFYYAANNGAKIASCSWGSSNSGGIGAAATYFLNSGGLIFVAAGNAGNQTADYLNARGDCISVAATDESDNAASFTTYGTWVDICAPGNNIYSTYHDHTDPNTNYWASLSGTSMATPMTAGVAALIWSHNPGWSATQVRNQLYSSADNIDAYLSAQYIGKMGVGRINAYNAVNTGPPPAPAAEFSGSPTSGTEPLTVNFTDQSTGSITSWSWTFGDGGNSSAQNPSHQYNSAGNYTVSLTVSGPGGSDGETKTNYITVNPCNPPTAGFVGSPTSGDYPLQVNFTNQSTGGTSWSWNFGDGGNSSAQNPSHIYTSSGTYTVTLTATNSCGSDQMVRTNYITVTTPPCNAPVAEFSGSPTSGNYPLNVNFTDLSTNSPTSWSWNFGDGGNSSAQNPSHSYTSAGTYTVSLTATNSCGSDGETKTAYVTVSEPSSDYADLPYYTGFESGSLDQYWFTQSNNDEGRIQVTSAYSPIGSYHLTMDDNTNGSQYAQNEGWLRLNLAGKSQVELSFMWKEFGDEDHSQDGVYLSDNGGSSFAKIYDLVGGTTNYQEIVLDIDQLASGAGLSLTGTFVVKFQQYDNYGISTDGFAFDEINVISMDVPPVAEFSGVPTSGSAPLQVNFTDQSVNNPTGWSWTFGDGGNSSAQNPSHSYTSPGTYTVSLTASNAFGSDNETKTAYITVNEPSAWTTITYDDFESGFGNYSDGGADCILYTGGTYAHQGSNAADIQDDSRSSYFQHSGTYNVSGYSEMEVDFWYYPVSMDNSNEGFFLQYYNGSSWQTVDSWYLNSDFQNNNFYHETVTISSSQYNFPSNARLRFMCDGSGNADDVYIDEIEWRGMGGTSSLAGMTTNELPDKFEVHQNYPNPFNPSTEISFALPEAAHVSVEIFNILGQQVNLLLDDYVTAGVKTLTWNATDQSGHPVTTGIYFYRILVDNRKPVTKKMMLLR